MIGIGAAFGITQFGAQPCEETADLSKPCGDPHGGLQLMRTLTSTATFDLTPSGSFAVENTIEGPDYVARRGQLYGITQPKK